jgi:protein gp37
MTKIQWTDQVWNPVTGCTKISAGCKHCYAETIANRRLPHGGFTDRPFTEVRCHTDRLDAPLHWKKPRRVFVNSMSDLFHESVSVGFTDQVFAVMALARRHTFQVLTKRVGSMLDYMRNAGTRKRIAIAQEKFAPHAGIGPSDIPWPLPNVWLGVSVENQKTADERIPLLIQTPAAVRFLSCEPLLGPIDLTMALEAFHGHDAMLNRNPSPIQWIIAGGESGPHARPCDVAWIRAIVQQCRAAGAPCFVKQLGARPMWPTPIVDQSPDSIVRHGEYDPGDLSMRLKDRKGGDPSEWPEDIRVREFPLAPSGECAMMRGDG